MNKQVIAIANCRVSSDEQLQNNSLKRQRDSVTQAAERLGAMIPENAWWSGSVSSKAGTNITRKDLQEMLQYCKDHKAVRFAIFDEYDRFMRSVNEGAYFEVMFEQLGVKVWYASESDTFNGNDAMAKFMRSMSAFKAEGSNEERQRKSINGQTAALKEGRYTFNPKPGYYKIPGTRAGIHDVHPKRGPALKKILNDIAERRVTPTQGLVELNKSDFMADGHSLYKMDKFRKIATDPYYAGIIEINKQVKVRNENGLHEPLITPEQHNLLVYIFDNKRKTQLGPRKNGNPEFPVSNIVHCDLCKDKTNGRYVGYNHGNGQNPDLVYRKYRCRGCNRYLTREDVHTGVSKQFQDNPITQKGAQDVIRALNIVWKQEESRAEHETQRIRDKIKLLDGLIHEQVEAVTNSKFASVKDEIMASIEKKKLEISKLESQLNDIQSVVHDDKEEFLNFAYDFIDNMGTNFLDTELVSKENRLRCKQIVFPAGFCVDANNKVYTPEISDLYRLARKKKDTEVPDFAHMVRVRRLKLLASSLARKRSIN